MLYNYYATGAFSDLRKKQGYDVLAPFVYRGSYKHKRLIKYPLLARLGKIFLPQIYVEKDFSFFRSDICKKNKRVSGISFKKLLLDGFSVTEWGTFIIDLNQSFDKLQKKMDYSLRKQIKKGERLNFSVRRVTDENLFKAYYRLLYGARERMGFKTDNYKLVKRLWNYLGEGSGARRPCYQVFLCYDGAGILLAGLGLFVNYNDGQCIEVGAGRSEAAAKLPAGDFVKWEIIKWAKLQGLKYFDLAGANVNAEAGTKDFNIYRYKAKWGGCYYPVFNYTKTSGI